MEILRLSSLADLVGDGLDAVRRMGRAGGVLAMAAGAAFGGLGLFVWRSAGQHRPVETDHWATELRVFAFLLFGLSLSAAAFGARQAISPRRGRPVLPPLPAKDLVSALRFAPRPCFVCLDCRRLFTSLECAGPCPQCGSTAQCLEVRGPEDVKMVEAAVGDGA